ncbi:MAG: response regulator [Planctomycetaceae bacterium]|nr:MAG: response regulator [Planctomycetaceae bacterium]
MPSELADGSRMPPRPSVLLIGDRQHRDFADAILWLQQHCRLQTAADPDAANQVLDQTGLPQVVLFVQSRPGQFAQADIETIHARSPLSRLVVLLGSWCEGEMRTGKPWSGVVRIYWHQWAARIIPELMSASAGGGGVWRLPRTASGTEQFAQATEGPWPSGRGLVVIHTRLFCDYQALSDACQAGGYSSTWDRPDHSSFADGATCVLCTLIGGDPRETAVVTRLANRHAPAPVIVLLDFLRCDDRRRMLEAGAAATLAKPLLVGDLLWHIHQQCLGSGTAAVVPSSDR